MTKSTGMPFRTRSKQDLGCRYTIVDKTQSLICYNDVIHLQIFSKTKTESSGWSRELVVAEAKAQIWEFCEALDRDHQASEEGGFGTHNQDWGRWGSLEAPGGWDLLRVPQGSGCCGTVWLTSLCNTVWTSEAVPLGNWGDGSPSSKKGAQKVCYN